ncbi:undecaprenyldiphospho-muramoylpentapeptide beta-N-acetylglucosaminyltransferase [bacterium]|nr:undecaprenyldiphospho-muramoylpentapeptide beta-N-acetylglucosaminyltransferase [bacterium]
MKSKIVLTGGGTGGHIYPLIALVKEMKKLSPPSLDLEFYFLGPSHPDLKKLEEENVSIILIRSGKLRRYFNFSAIIQNIKDLFWNIPLGTFQSYKILKNLNPSLIFSKGGYGSIPVILAAKLLKIPLFIHESDKIASLSTRIASKYANKIFVAFSNTKGIAKEKTIFSGNPIRKELTEGNKEDAYKMFNIIGKRPIILIVGGSQGAQRINEVIINALPKLLDMFEIIHQCGKKNEKLIKESIPFLITPEQKKYYHLFGFLNEEQLKNAYRVADLVISRAGAGAIFEIASNGKPSILIPLPESAQNHQRANAYYYAKLGAAKVIEEESFKPHFIVEVLREMFSKPRELMQMGRLAKDFIKKDASFIIASYLLGYLDKLKQNRL